MKLGNAVSPLQPPAPNSTASGPPVSPNALIISIEREGFCSRATTCSAFDLNASDRELFAEPVGNVEQSGQVIVELTMGGAAVIAVENL